MPAQYTELNKTACLMEFDQGVAALRTEAVWVGQINRAVHPLYSRR